MGLFSRGEKVRGWAQIVSTTQAPYQASAGVCKMQVVVQAEGVPATHVEASRICKVRKWPRPGMAIPCELDPRQPEDFKLLWDEVEADEDQARRQAAMLAQQMNAQPAQAGAQFGQGAGGLAGMIPPGAQVQIVNASGGTPSAEQLAKLEQMLGRDLDGDGQIGSASRLAAAMPPPAGAVVPPPPPPLAAAPGGADDRIAALERLAALRSQGILTDVDFDAEKRRILGA